MGHTHESDTTPDSGGGRIAAVDHTHACTHDLPPRESHIHSHTHTLTRAHTYTAALLVTSMATTGHFPVADSVASESLPLLNVHTRHLIFAPPTLTRHHCHPLTRRAVSMVTLVYTQVNIV